MLETNHCVLGDVTTDFYSIYSVSANTMELHVSYYKGDRGLNSLLTSVKLEWLLPTCVQGTLRLEVPAGLEGSQTKALLLAASTVFPISGQVGEIAQPAESRLTVGEKKGVGVGGGISKLSLFHILAHNFWRG